MAFPGRANLYEPGAEGCVGSVVPCAKFSFVELRYYQCVEKDNGYGLDQQLHKAKGELKPCPNGQTLPLPSKRSATFQDGVGSWQGRTRAHVIFTIFPWTLRFKVRVRTRTLLKSRFCKTPQDWKYDCPWWVHALLPLFTLQHTSRKFFFRSKELPTSICSCLQKSVILLQDFCVNTIWDASNQA